MRNVGFRHVFPLKMRSWRVCVGSFWAHVEVVCAHLGDLGRSWSTWTEILEDLGQQEAGKRQPEGQRGALVEISGVKRGDEGRRGFGSAAWGWPAGGGGDTTLVPELAKSSNPARPFSMVGRISTPYGSHRRPGPFRYPHV